MPTPTQQLQRLLTNGTRSADFKQSAMTLVRQGADITVQANFRAHPTLLHILARTNNNGSNNDEIAELVRINRNILKCKDNNGRTALQSLIDALHWQECTFNNFKQSAMALARLGADTTLRSTSGAHPTLLHVFARKNKNGANNDAMAELVQLNPNVVASTDNNGRTALQSLMDALHWQQCSFESFKQSAMILARQGSDITKRSTSGAHPTLLHVLARKNQSGLNNDDIVELVGLNCNALTSTDNNGRTALQSLMDALHWKECTFDNFKQSAMTLARQRTDITMRSTSGAHPTLLHVFARKNENGINNNDMAELVQLNPNVLTSTDNNGRTALQSLMDALHWQQCSFESFKQSAMVLARQGANLSQQGTAGARNTLLHVLVLKHRDENNGEIDALIAFNNNVINFKDGNGQTPVHSLLSNNANVTVEVFDRLLSATNLNLNDNQNATLLHAACRSGNLPAVKHLFGRGLSLTALTNSNRTIIHYAVPSGNTMLIQWLLNTRQIDINAKNQSGETALHRATRQNNREVIELLARNGADLTIKNNEGLRASEIAANMGYHDLVPYLLNPKDEFFQKIQAMHNYGILLRDQGVSKGQVAIDLASDLTAKAHQFFEQEPAQRNFAEFEPRFSALLHSKDQEMSAYRIAWGTIVANIAISLTGVGLLFISGKLIHSKVTEGRALFFFQKNRTTSEEKIADIEQSAHLIAQSA
jgi:ankyrin repeat protein